MKHQVLLSLAMAVSATAQAKGSEPDGPLFRDSLYLDEIVVTGQGGALQRRRLSAKVDKISAKDLGSLPTDRLDHLLQDALPNVQVNINSGQPGTTSNIRARGLSSAYSNSTPVVYVDGVRVDNLNTGATIGFRPSGYSTEPYGLSDLPMGETAASGSLSDIPLENIDHIEYLTGGAATTLYGSDAANGVILITTKKGGDGMFHATAGVDIGLTTADSHWYHFNRTSDLLHQTGIYQKYRVGFSGGNDRFGYSLGASMQHDDGMMIHNGNENKKYDLRYGSRLKINHWLKYDNSFGFVASDFSRRRNGNQGLYTALWTTECSAATDMHYTAADGTQRNYQADIDAMDDYEYSSFKNFVDKAEALQDNKESIKRFQMAHTLTLTPLAGLTVKGILGIDYRADDFKEIITNAYLMHTQVKPEGTTDAGRVNNTSRNTLGITADASAEYRSRWADMVSNIATAGFQYFSTDDHQAAYNGRGVRDGARVMSGAASITANEVKSHINSYGVYMQDNIGFFDRYYLDLGLRVDYNSAFGDNVGWQAYPKVGLSYMLTEERFMQPVVGSGIINNVRLRANYGVAGTYPPAYSYEATVNENPYLGQQAATFGKQGNPNLGPEKKHSYEAGFDASFFNDILDITFTYYYSVTRDALFSVPTLPSSGRESHYLANVGKISNRGIELTLGLKPVDTRSWTVDVHGSLNTNRNRVVSTGGLPTFLIGGFSSRTIMTAVTEGKPVGYLYGAKAVLNADGTLKEVEQGADLGSTIPTLYGNLRANLRYRQWQLFVSGDWQTGSYLHEWNRQFRFRKGLKDSAIPDAALMGQTQGQAWLNFTNCFVEKADFFKVRNIRLDYTFHPRNLGVQNVNLAFNVYNPFSFTCAQDDPEATLSGARSQGAVSTGGINYASFSAPRQFIFSVNVSL